MPGPKGSKKEIASNSKTQSAVEKEIIAAVELERNKYSEKLKGLEQEGTALNQREKEAKAAWEACDKTKAILILINDITVITHEKKMLKGKEASLKAEVYKTKLKAVEAKLSKCKEEKKGLELEQEKNKSKETAAKEATANLKKHEDKKRKLLKTAEKALSEKTLDILMKTRVSALGDIKTVAIASLAGDKTPDSFAKACLDKRDASFQKDIVSYTATGESIAACRATLLEQVNKGQDGMRLALRAQLAGIELQYDNTFDGKSKPLSDKTKVSLIGLSHVQVKARQRKEVLTSDASSDEGKANIKQELDRGLKDRSSALTAQKIGGSYKIELCQMDDSELEKFSSAVQTIQGKFGMGATLDVMRKILEGHDKLKAVALQVETREVTDLNLETMEQAFSPHSDSAADSDDRYAATRKELLETVIAEGKEAEAAEAAEEAKAAKQSKAAEELQAPDDTQPPPKPPLEEVIPSPAALKKEEVAPEVVVPEPNPDAPKPPLVPPVGEPNQAAVEVKEDVETEALDDEEVVDDLSSLNSPDPVAEPIPDEQDDDIQKELTDDEVDEEEPYSPELGAEVEEEKPKESLLERLGRVAAAHRLDFSKHIEQSHEPVSDSESDDEEEVAIPIKTQLEEALELQRILTEALETEQKRSDAMKDQRDTALADGSKLRSMLRRAGAKGAEFKQETKQKDAELLQKDAELLKFKATLRKAVGMVNELNRDKADYAVLQAQHAKLIDIGFSVAAQRKEEEEQKAKLKLIIKKFMRNNQAFVSAIRGRDEEETPDDSVSDKHEYREDDLEAMGLEQLNQVINSLMTAESEALAGVLDELEKAEKKFESEIESKDKIIGTLQPYLDRVNTAVLEAHEMHSELEEATAKAKSLEADLAEAKKETKDMKSSCAELVLKNTTLEGDCGRFALKVAELEQRSSQLEMQLKEEQEKSAAHVELNEKLHSKTKELEQQTAAQVDAVSSLQSQISELEQKGTQSEAEKADLQRLNTSLAEEKDSLALKNTELSQSLAQQTELAASEKQIANAALSQSAEELSLLKATHSKAAEELVALKGASSLDEAKIAALESSVQTQAKSIEAAETEHKLELEARDAAQRELEATLNAQVTAAGQQAEAARSDVSDLMSRLTALTSKLDASKESGAQESEEQAAKIKELSEELDASKALAIKKAAEHEAALEKVVSEAKAEVDEAKSSVKLTQKALEVVKAAVVAAEASEATTEKQKTALEGRVKTLESEATAAEIRQSEALKDVRTRLQQQEGVHADALSAVTTDLSEAKAKLASAESNASLSDVERKKLSDEVTSLKAAQQAAASQHAESHQAFTEQVSVLTAALQSKTEEQASGAEEFEDEFTREQASEAQSASPKSRSTLNPNAKKFVPASKQEKQDSNPSEALRVGERESEERVPAQSVDEQLREAREIAREKYAKKKHQEKHQKVVTRSGLGSGAEVEEFPQSPSSRKEGKRIPSSAHQASQVEVKSASAIDFPELPTGSEAAESNPDRAAELLKDMLGENDRLEALAAEDVQKITQYMAALNKAQEEYDDIPTDDNQVKLRKAKIELSWALPEGVDTDLMAMQRRLKALDASPESVQTSQQTQEGSSERRLVAPIGAEKPTPTEEKDSKEESKEKGSEKTEVPPSPLYISDLQAGPFAPPNPSLDPDDLQRRFDALKEGGQSSSETPTGPDLPSTYDLAERFQRLRGWSASSPTSHDLEPDLSADSVEGDGNTLPLDTPSIEESTPVAIPTEPPSSSLVEEGRAPLELLAAQEEAKLAKEREVSTESVAASSERVTQANQPSSARKLLIGFAGLLMTAGSFVASKVSTSPNEVDFFDFDDTAVPPAGTYNEDTTDRNAEQPDSQISTSVAGGDANTSGLDWSVSLPLQLSDGRTLTSEEWGSDWHVDSLGDPASSPSNQLPIRYNPQEWGFPSDEHAEVFGAVAEEPGNNAGLVPGDGQPARVMRLRFPYNKAFEASAFGNRGNFDASSPLGYNDNLPDSSALVLSSPGLDTSLKTSGSTVVVHSTTHIEVQPQGLFGTYHISYNGMSVNLDARIINAIFSAMGILPVGSFEENMRQLFLGGASGNEVVTSGAHGPGSRWSGESVSPLGEERSLLEERPGDNSGFNWRISLKSDSQDDSSGWFVFDGVPSRHLPTAEKNAIQVFGAAAEEPGNVIRLVRGDGSARAMTLVPSYGAGSSEVSVPWNCWSQGGLSLAPYNNSGESTVLALTSPGSKSSSQALAPIVYPTIHIEPWHQDFLQKRNARFKNAKFSGMGTLMMGVILANLGERLLGNGQEQEEASSGAGQFGDEWAGKDPAPLQTERTRPVNPSSLEQPQAPSPEEKVVKALKEIELKLAALNVMALPFLKTIYQASAKHYAEALKKHLTELSTGCNALEKVLQAKQRAMLDGEADERLDEKLALIAEIKRQLAGGGAEASSNKGILPAINSAIENKRSIHITSSPGYKISYKDENKAAIDRELRAGSAVIVSTIQELHYDEVDRVTAGDLRVHTISSEYSDASEEKVLGVFTEARDVMRDESGVETENIKMTFTQFPIEGEAQAISAMAMVTQFVSSLEKPPSKAHPIYLNGSNETELAFIGVALRIVCEDMEGFEVDGIITESQEIPKDYKEEKVFKDHFGSNTVKRLITETKKLASEKFLKESAETANKSAAEMLQLYKEELEETVKKGQDKEAKGAPADERRKGP